MRATTTNLVVEAISWHVPALTEASLIAPMKDYLLLGRLRSGV
jgi:hypothetical protein